MWRTLYRWLAVLVTLAALSFPAMAQETPAKSPAAEEPELPMKEYTVAALTFMLVMVVVCKPSRHQG